MDGSHGATRTTGMIVNPLYSEDNAVGGVSNPMYYSSYTTVIPEDPSLPGSPIGGGGGDGYLSIAADDE